MDDYRLRAPQFTLSAAQGNATKERRPTGGRPVQGQAVRAGAARPPPSRSLLRALWALVLLLLLLRLFCLGSYPLMDTSEARYGEIARVMLTSGNYLTPQEVPGTPFWAKPPLYAWLSTAAMRMLGVTEFALRLPSWICALLVLALSAVWSASLLRVRDLAGAAPLAMLPRSTALPPAPGAALAPALTLALLASSLGFFAAAGAVMTDPALVVCTTAMLVCFHQVVLAEARGTAWRYGFFFAIGLGLLAKGPVILLYAGLPLGLWTLSCWPLRATLLTVWRALPWVRGSALAAAICVPWYLLAERQTPGFLDYFLLGEHLRRFLQPGWTGDRYGTAHAEPLGTIWAYLALALGPHSLLVGGAACVSLRRWWRRRCAAGRTPTPGTSATPGLGASRADAPTRLPLLAAVAPVVVFSLAGNIIWTYVLPVLPPLCVILADFLAARLTLPARRWWRWSTGASLAAAALILPLAWLYFVPGHVADHSAAALLAQWRARQPQSPGALLYLGRKAPASLRFYSAGAVTAISSLVPALRDIAPGQALYLALAPAETAAVQQEVAAAQERVGQARLRLLTQAVAANKDMVLLYVCATAPAAPDSCGARRR